jgi:hypothetical protein
LHTPNRPKEPEHHDAHHRPCWGQPRHSVIHELDHRRNDGFDVRVLSNSGTNQVSIAVADGRAGECFAFEIAPADAVDAFHHPYAYAPRRKPVAPQPAEEDPQEPAADTDDGSPLRRMIGRVRAVWSEMDYAQRRLLEIRTGVPMVPARSVAEEQEMDPAITTTIAC